MPIFTNYANHCQPKYDAINAFGSSREKQASTGARAVVLKDTLEQS